MESFVPYLSPVSLCTTTQMKKRKTWNVINVHIYIQYNERRKTRRLICLFCKWQQTNNIAFFVLFFLCFVLTWFLFSLLLLLILIWNFAELQEFVRRYSMCIHRCLRCLMKYRWNVFATEIVNKWIVINIKRVAAKCKMCTCIRLYVCICVCASLADMDFSSSQNHVQCNFWRRCFHILFGHLYKLLSSSPAYDCSNAV